MSRVLALLCLFCSVSRTEKMTEDSAPVVPNGIILWVRDEELRSQAQNLEGVLAFLDLS